MSFLILWHLLACEEASVVSEAWISWLAVVNKFFVACQVIVARFSRVHQRREFV